MQELEAADVVSETAEWGWIRWRLAPGLAESGASLTASEVKLLPAKAQERHCHPDADELTYVIAGEGQQEIAGRAAFAISAGDVFCVPRGVLHRTRNTGAHHLQLLVVYTPGGAIKSASASDIAHDVVVGQDDEPGRSWLDAAKQEAGYWPQW